jgi:hypothetical protein
MHRDARDVARTSGAGASGPLRLGGRSEPRAELRGELDQVVGERTDGSTAGDEPAADPLVA